MTEIHALLRIGIFFMIKYMFDTNMVSYFVADKGRVRTRLFEQSVTPNELAISSIVQAELLKGLSLKPNAKHLHIAVTRFINSVHLLSWGSKAAAGYARLSVLLRQHGRALGAMDTLIAAHAIAENLTLVTHDEALQNVPGLKTVDWY